MELAMRFECWREVKHTNTSWGLTWFLAAEFCKRFYASHGLVPRVIMKEGLGYYGIAIHQVSCAVHSASTEPLGRLTMLGDVENWRRSGSADERLYLSDRCESGVETSELVRAAIAHLDLTPFPQTSHLTCRHKRWGDSFVLCFEVAAYLALKYDMGEIAILNHPAHVDRKLSEKDDQVSMKEHPGGILFVRNDKELLIAGDGRLLDGSGASLWLEYMEGRSISALAKLVESRLDTRNT